LRISGEGIDGDLAGARGEPALAEIDRADPGISRRVDPKRGWSHPADGLPFGVEELREPANLRARNLDTVDGCDLVEQGRLDARSRPEPPGEVGFGAGRPDLEVDPTGRLGDHPVNDRSIVSVSMRLPATNATPSTIASVVSAKRSLCATRLRHVTAHTLRPPTSSCGRAPAPR
jgi:hypothetical protein